jgi:hypothetical protein
MNKKNNYVVCFTAYRECASECAHDAEIEMIKMITHELTHRNVEDVFDREVRSKELHDIIVKGREYDSRGIKRKWLQTGL